MPRGKPFGAPAGAYLLPRGADAPTTARTVGLPPRGGQYFLSKRKKVPKKARGTATPEAARPAARRGLRSAVAPSGLSSTSVRCAHPPGKRLLLPILPAGLAMSRAMELASFRIRAERARARLFPPSKWAGLFPSAAYRRSAPPAGGAGQTQPMRVGMLRRRLDGFAVSINRPVSQLTVGGGLT